MPESKKHKTGPKRRDAATVLVPGTGRGEGTGTGTGRGKFAAAYSAFSTSVMIQRAGTNESNWFFNSYCVNVMR